MTVIRGFCADKHSSKCGMKNPAECKWHAHTAKQARAEEKPDPEAERVAQSWETAPLY